MNQCQMMGKALMAAQKIDSSNLILWLDGIDNTRNGHSTTTTVWEDLSGNSHDFIKLNNDPVWDDKSWVGTKYIYTHLGCYDKLLENVPEFTVEAFFQSSYSEGWFFNSRETNANAGGFQFCNYEWGYNTFGVFAPAGTYHSLVNGITYPAPGDCCFAFTYKNGVLSLYSNGIPDSSYNVTDADVDAIRERSIYTVGSAFPWSNNPGFAPSGKVFSIKIFDKCLSADEISKSYQDNVARFLTGE